MSTATWTRDTIHDSAEDIRATLRAEYIREGSLAPARAILFTHVDPDTGRRCAAVWQMTMPLPSGEPSKVDARKNGYVGFIRRLTERTDAVAVAVASECWVGGDAYDRPEDDPARRELLIFVLKSVRFGTTIWTAQISRGPDGKTTVSAWERHDNANAGRFSAMLPDLD